MNPKSPQRYVNNSVDTSQDSRVHSSHNSPSRTRGTGLPDGSSRHLPTNSMVALHPSSEDVRIYEIAVMYVPDLTSHAEGELLRELEVLFNEAGATLLFKDPWTKRGLAYPIKGYQEAKFVIYYYEVDPAKMRDVDQALKLNKSVLRHLIVIPPKGYEAVSYEEKYQYWLKNRETVKEARTREKEEKVKQNVIDKARRETRKAQEKKPVAKAPVEMEKLSQSLDKLISDEDLKI